MTQPGGVTKFNLIDIQDQMVIDNDPIAANFKTLGDGAWALTAASTYVGPAGQVFTIGQGAAARMRLNTDGSLEFADDGASTWPVHVDKPIGQNRLRVLGATNSDVAVDAPAHTGVAGLRLLAGDSIGNWAGSAGITFQARADNGTTFDLGILASQRHFRVSNSRRATVPIEVDADTDEVRLAGNLSLVAGSINGALSVNGPVTARSTLAVTGAATFASTVNVTGALTAATVRGNPIYIGSASISDAGNAGLSTSGNLSLAGNLYIPGGASFVPTRTTYQGGAYVGSNAGDRIQIGNHIDLAYDLVVGRNGQVNGGLNVSGAAGVGSSITVNGVSALLGRAYIGGAWDTGQALSVYGSGVASSFFYQRGSTAYRCWDNADFTYAVAGSANTLVQRDGAGQIQVGGLYMPTGAVGGKPAYVLGQSGDGWMRWWPANAIGPPGLSVLGTGLSVGSSGTGGNWQDVAVITVNRTGYWVLMVHFYFGGGAPAPYGGFVRMRWGGTIGTQQQFNNPAPGATNYGWHTGYDGGAVFVTNGQTVAAQMNCTTGMGMNGNLWAVFVPTTDYPGN